jgi:hypothetical protein
MTKAVDFLYSAWLRFDAAVGNLERAGAELARRIDWQDWQPGRRTVLCLRRSTFVKDVDQMRLRGTYNWAKVSAARVRKFQERWVPPEYRIQTYFYNYLETCLHRDKGLLARFAIAFLRQAMKVHPIDAVLAGNTDYWQDEVIKIACRHFGIPFLALPRENYSMEIDEINVGKRFVDSKFRFNGDGVAVFCEATRRTMVRSGSFPENSVWITGAPRIDHWFGVKLLPFEQRRTIVLLNYCHGYLADENFIEVANLFIAAAKASKGDALFALKSKKKNEEEVARREIPGFNEAPIEFLCEEPIHVIYPRCRAVIGVNSLASVEGFLAEMAVVVPNWSDARRIPEECLLLRDDPDDIAVTYFADSPDELANLLQRASAHQLPPKGDPKLRRERFCWHIDLPHDGTCSDRVHAFIAHYMDRAEAARAMAASTPKVA